jgi:hypothetical protein
MINFTTPLYKNMELVCAFRKVVVNSRHLNSKAHWAIGSALCTRDNRTKCFSFPSSIVLYQP